MANVPLATHQQRVVDEKTELDEKLDKLLAFVETETFKTLSLENQNLLLEQVHMMRQYSDILKRRIELF